jgi:hypothetical protein
MPFRWAIWIGLVTIAEGFVILSTMGKVFPGWRQQATFAYAKSQMKTRG